ncbi:translation initiation factor eIF-2B subunit epsilon [Neocloeon triangulifer]|uniref:translation initiation factor eIF-2B subunit epsilon n=1 Tax=Neocloeon triangulifer TaxID=2078957 RepID=UPI00286F11E6|nr:translation initiation factor eIF-2B subunit epsilon [Neocloeon triangulifer]
MSPRDKDDLKEREMLQAVVIDDLVSSEYGSAGLKSLLPFANIQAIDYTLSCLSDVGVKQTFVYTARRSEQLEDHIGRCGWNEPGSMAVKVVACEGSQSFGDLMRELDTSNSIQGNFLLLYADTVCTADLKPIINKHKATALKDKNAVITMVYTHTNPRHEGHSQERELALGLANGRVVFHKRVKTDSHDLEVPTELLLSNSSVELRFDLLDPCVAVCSLTVPPIFSDNFDFQTRDDFVKGLLLNEDILGHTMYAHVLEQAYVARAASLSSYHAMNMDVLRRWTFPMVPDASFLLTDAAFNYNIDQNVCSQPGVRIGRSDVEDCVIGSDSKIGNNCHLKMCVVGKNCVIKDEVQLNHAVLWDNCVIEKGTKADNIFAPANSQLDKSKVQKFSTLTSKNANQKEANEPSDTESSEEEADDFGQMDEYESFFNEVQDSLMRGFKEKVNTDDLVVEINSSRFANDIPASEVSQWVSKVIFGLPQQVSQPAKVVLSYFKPIFAKYVSNSAKDQLNCLTALEEVTTGANNAEEAARLLGLLYNWEILEEDPIIEWFENNAGDQLKQQQNMRTFITWLRSAEEESEESD